jgi:hypothetical protein
VAWTPRNGANDPFLWSGRAFQEVFIDLSASRSCINVSGLRLEHNAAPGHHGYQRASVLNTGVKITGARGPREDRSSVPFRFIVWRTSARKQDVIRLLIGAP